MCFAVALNLKEQDLGIRLNELWLRVIFLCANRFQPPQVRTSQWVQEQLQLLGRQSDGRISSTRTASGTIMGGKCFCTCKRQAPIAQPWILYRLIVLNAWIVLL